LPAGLRFVRRRCSGARGPVPVVAGDGAADRELVGHAGDADGGDVSCCRIVPEPAVTVQVWLGEGGCVKDGGPRRSRRSPPASRTRSFPFRVEREIVAAVVPQHDGALEPGDGGRRTVYVLAAQLTTTPVMLPVPTVPVPAGDVARLRRVGRLRLHRHPREGGPARHRRRQRERNRWRRDRERAGGRCLAARAPPAAEGAGHRAAEAVVRGHARDVDVGDVRRAHRPRAVADGGTPCVGDEGWPSTVTA